MAMTDNMAHGHGGGARVIFTAFFNWVTRYQKSISLSYYYLIVTSITKLLLERIEAKQESAVIYSIMSFFFFLVRFCGYMGGEIIVWLIARLLTTLTTVTYLTPLQSPSPGLRLYFAFQKRSSPERWMEKTEREQMITWCLAQTF